MRKFPLLISTILIATASFTFTSCTKDKTPEPQEQSTNEIEVKTVISLEAQNKVYMNISTGAYIPEAEINATNWDISFYAKDRNITVAVNSGNEGSGNAGAIIVETSFDELKNAPETGYLEGQEAIGNYLNWSSYTGSTTSPKHAVLPKPGLSIVIKTADNKYAKIQMLSLYQGNPNTTTPEFSDLATRPEFGYFSFRYATQTDGSRNF